MKVLIIDEHKLFADGIRNLLKQYDQTISTEYVDNIDLSYNKINSINSPNLIILGLNDHAKSDSYDLIRQLDQLNLDIPVIVSSITDSPSAAGLAIENNASGFICKNCSRKTMLNAILAVMNGEMYISKPSHQPSKEIQKADGITTRQHEILLLLAQGLLNKQIAYELDISANTVKVHLNDLFRRLQVTNRTAAVKYGHDYGLI